MLFNTDSLNKFKGKIIGYKDNDNTKGYIHISNYNLCVKTYQMVNHESFKAKISKTGNEFIATDNNVIKSNDINDVICVFPLFPLYPYGISI